MTRLARPNLIILTCWALIFPYFANTAWIAGKPPVFSASLLYIYAPDSIYWSDLTGKLLRDNDTLYIFPGVAYKVWCEVLPEGRPKIGSNNRMVIAHQPIAWTTMTHVELYPNLFRTLNELADKGSDPAKLWCDYTNGTKKLRTEVTLRSFSIANTTCDYSTVSHLVVEDSLVYFTCTSWSGNPRPEHSCVVVSDEGASRLPAQVVSVTRLSESQVVTKFSMLASRSNQGASIECSTAQQMAYKGSGRNFKESHIQKVLPLGEAHFTFASESTKHCEMFLAGDYSVTIRCQSAASLPETAHSCRINGANGTESLPLMAKIQGATYTTETTFNNSWAYQSATVTCVLQQQLFNSKNFSFNVPGFSKSEKSCQFSQLDEGLQAKCFSGNGLPSSEHSCIIELNNGKTPISAKETIRKNGSQISSYLMPKDSLYRGSQVICTINQDGFPRAVFVHSVPRFTESHKDCRFVNSSWEVKVSCKFSSGFPTTRSECQLLVTNSSVRLNLRLDQERASVAAEPFRNSYTVKLPGPDVSHAGGRIVCRVYQDSLFTKTFTHRIAEYRKIPSPTPPRQSLAERHTEVIRPTATSEPEATVQPDLKMSNQTVITLSLALLVALLLLLLMALPIHAMRRCLSRNRKGGGAVPSPVQASTVIAAPTVAPVIRRVRMAQPLQLQQHRKPLLGFSQQLLPDICSHRGYRAKRMDGAMQDIDQYSMYELGYQPDPENKRKSVLAEALMRYQLEQNKREFRFSM